MAYRPVKVITIDAANYAAGDKREDEAIGEDDRAGPKSRDNAVFERLKKSVAYIKASVRRVTAFCASNSSISRPTRLERRRPLVCTANPSDSNHS